MVQAFGASLTRSGDQNLGLVVFMLDRNVVRVERYDLQELQEGVNHISRKVSNEHCSYVIHMGERGQHVSALNLNPSNVREMRVSTYRGKKAIDYSFDWSKLVLLDPQQAQNVVRTESEVTSIVHEAAQAVDVQQENATSDANIFRKAKRSVKKSKVTSTVVVSWNQQSKTVKTLEFERPIESIIAFVMPMSLFKEEETRMHEMKKADLVGNGFMAKVQDAQASEHENVAAEQIHDTASATAALADEFTKRRSKTRAGESSRVDVPMACITPDHGCNSWPAYAYAKLVALTNYLYNCELC